MLLAKKLVAFLKENIRLSLGAIRGQLLRTVLTVLIIAIGITSLVGTLTSIDALQSSISNNFTSMGANTFTIRNRNMTLRIGDNGRGPKPFKSITYNDAQRFKREFNFPAVTSVSTFATGNATLKFQSKKTNPNMRVLGSDENYMSTSSMELEKGRNFSNKEVQFGDAVAIVGKDIVDALFTINEDPIDKIITIGSGKYKIIGILKSKGNSIGFSGDKIAILTLNNVRQYFSRPNMTFSISVVCNNAQLVDIAIGEATNTFRTIRKLGVTAKDNFEITKSDSLANMLMEDSSKVTIGATVI